MSTSKDISGHKICPLGVKLISSIRKFHFSSSACFNYYVFHADPVVYISRTNINVILKLGS